MQLKEQSIFFTTLRDSQTKIRVLEEDLGCIEDRSVVMAVYQPLQHSVA